MVGKNSLEGDELVVFDIAAGFSESMHKIFIDQVDLLRILNLNTLPVSIAHEDKRSWGLRLGINRVKDSGGYRHDGITSYGVGYARKWGKATIGYVMIDVAGHTIAPFVRLRPQLNLKFDLGQMRTRLYFGAESANYVFKFKNVLGGKIQYQLNKRYAVNLEFSDEDSNRALIGLTSYW